MTKVIPDKVVFVTTQGWEIERRECECAKVHPALRDQCLCLCATKTGMTEGIFRSPHNDAVTKRLA